MTPNTLQNLCKEVIVKTGLNRSVLPKLLQKDFGYCKMCNKDFVINFDGYFIDWINYHKEIYYYLCFDICEPCFEKASVLWWLWETDMFVEPGIPQDETSTIKSSIIGTKDIRLSPDEIVILEKPVRQFWYDIFNFKTTGGRNSVTT